jgi:hypothetical protein
VSLELHDVKENRKSDHETDGDHSDVSLR